MLLCRGKGQSIAVSLAKTKLMTQTGSGSHLCSASPSLIQTTHHTTVLVRSLFCLPVGTDTHNYITFIICFERMKWSYGCRCLDNVDRAVLTLLGMCIFSTGNAKTHMHTVYCNCKKYICITCNTITMQFINLWTDLMVQMNKWKLVKMSRVRVILIFVVPSLWRHAPSFWWRKSTL